MRTVYNLDFGWRFHRGDLPEEAGNKRDILRKAGEAVGGAQREFDDTDWRLLDLPHDYINESAFGEDYIQSHGYREQDNAWYRKSFTLDKSLADKSLLLCFEGVSADADFYFNGSLMAHGFSAFTETVFDISDRAFFDGRPNVLAVHLNGFATEGWWYEGAGIYRHVNLYATEKLHVAHDGLYAKPILKAGTKNSWNVEITTTLQNDAYEEDAAYVRATIFDGDTVIAQKVSKLTTVAKLKQSDVKQRLSVSRPTRWDVDNPKLYTVQVEVLKDGEVIDADSTRIGFRTFYMDAEKGFFLNDRPLKIKGIACHHDHACVGVAVPDAVQRFRIERLKELGANAYRCGHHPHAKEIYEACDELGIMVVDENRQFETRNEVLEAVRVMVKHARNHPSVVFYSLFNEEPLQNAAEGAKMLRRLREVTRELDDTRLITGAIHTLGINPDGAVNYVDVIGKNYCLLDDYTERVHAQYPNLPLMGSENNSCTTTRGCYKSDRNAHVLSQYDGEEVVPWGQSIATTWDYARKHDFYAGVFLWTGFDFRGEPTPFKWPSVSSQFGIMDTCGFPKEAFYYNQACFTEKPMVHLMPHWNWTEGETVRVVAITNCDEAELFVNGVSLGKKAADVCDQPMWEVPFKKGRIEAKAYKNGKCVARDVQRTTGKPRVIKIDTVRDYVTDDGLDTVIVNCSVVDSRGRKVPTANNHLYFEIEGDGVLLGVGNGDPNSHESDVAPERNLFAGHCQALVRVLPGAKTLKIRITGDKLETAEFAPAIIPVKAPDCIFSCSNHQLQGITMSEVTDERPDPLIVLSDDNQNSFTPPAGLGGDGYPGDYRGGWRIWRVIPSFPKCDVDREYTLKFPEVRSNVLEVYVDGKKVLENNQKLFDNYVVCNFTVKAGAESAEIRILTYVEPTVFTSGFRYYAMSLIDHGKK